MKRNVLLLFLSQGLLVTCASLLFASAPLVGDILANEKTLATLPLALVFLIRMVTTVPASMFMKQFGRRLGFMTSAVFGLVGSVVTTMGIFISNFSLFSAGAAQHDLGWVMVNLLVVPFLVLILIANLWLRRKPHRLDPDTKASL